MGRPNDAGSGEDSFGGCGSGTMVRRRSWAELGSWPPIEGQAATETAFGVATWQETWRGGRVCACSGLKRLNNTENCTGTDVTGVLGMLGVLDEGAS
ncbi:hypothetical protein IF2G_01822 [Cordyceps javanica]|nr:hypothetical protein IF2G_01822 [Cordyceps javanica]